MIALKRDGIGAFAETAKMILEMRRW